MNESSNAESSFYEDQLDNELECISGSGSRASGVPVKSPNSNNTSNIPVQNNIYSMHSGQTKHDEFMRHHNSQYSTSNTNANGNLNNSGKPAKAKSGNHVSFNINNAIYTSRQETPIPIAVLKQQAAVAAAAAAVANISTGSNSGVYGSASDRHASRMGENIKPILVQNGGNPYEQSVCEVNTNTNGSSGGGVSSPLQSSIKKSSGISDLLTQYVQMNSEKDMLKQQQHQYLQQALTKSAINNTTTNNPNNANSSSSKTDTKTTIL